MTMLSSRRLPVGAEVSPEGVHFRVWAPDAHRVAVKLQKGAGQFVELEREERGYFSTFVHGEGPGLLYRFQINGLDPLYPDPASRYQPHGPHGPSQVVDPSLFQWNDYSWRGIPSEGRVIYEMHIGTFTPKGTWKSARNELQELAEIGISIIEMMPVNDFPGRFGWGYDGVNLFAPSHLYGKPDDLREFIDHAHSLGIAVILDVVYNHFGPDGNYLRQFSHHYFTEKYETEWGDAINFDGEESQSVREYFIANAKHWIDEYHFDGLRLDATESIYDSSPVHILAEISQQARHASFTGRAYLTAENGLQLAEHVLPIEQGGCGLDALWNDDFHHSASVRLTGRNEAYQVNYSGSPQEFISALKYGYLYQGQWYIWNDKYRGTPSLQQNPDSFVIFIQNHDQISNSVHGWRIDRLADPGNYRAMTALLLLAPATPLLFQGQEFASSAPFHYFADHQPELAEKVHKGRRGYLEKFPSIATPESQERLPSPSDPMTFAACKLDLSERKSHGQAYALHRGLIALRRHDEVFREPLKKGVDGAVLSGDAFALRYFGKEGQTRLMIINFGVDLFLKPAPEPLLAPPKGTRWEILWSSENPAYGGGGTPGLAANAPWRILGHSALVLIPAEEPNSGP
jgi:maltooligosyltrehalose trehalohydrolase